jgi:hypothetical protein
MMRRKRWIPLLALAALAAACTGPRQNTGARSHPSSPTVRHAGDLLVMATGNGLIALDSATGSVLFDGAATPALSDGSKVFTARQEDGWTVLRGIDVSAGKTVSTLRLPADLAIRVVASDGSAVALMAPLPMGAGRWTPQRRSITDMVVTDAAGQFKRYHLKGNFEPEAFATDAASLYLISYVPPANPVAYRVVRLDLMDGTVYPVFGREKTPVETMSGTRLMQLSSADASRLYTLYTSQPSRYAKGYDSWQASAHGSVAFVHTLAADSGWAICVGLPRPLWAGDPEYEAMALTPDGTTLYVVDTDRGIVAAMDAANLTSRVVARLDFGLQGTGQTRASMSPDGGTLFVARGSGVVALNSTTLRLTQAWALGGPITGLGFSADGSRMYVAMPDKVEVVDPANGHTLRAVTAPQTGSIEYVGALSQP